MSGDASAVAVQLDPERLLAALPDPVIVVDRVGCLQWANVAAVEQLDWPVDRWIGRPGLLLVHPDDLPVAELALDSVRQKPVGTPIELRIRTGSGAWRLMELRGRAALDDPGVGGIVLVLRDITDRRRWELAAGDGAVVQAIVQYASVVIFHLHADGRVRTASSALLRTLGVDQEATEDRPFVELVAPDDAPAVSAALARAYADGGAQTLEARLLRGDGEPVWHRLTMVGLVDDPVVDGLVVTAQDVASLAEARRRLQHLATHDSLTGIANRAALLQALADHLARGEAVTAVFVDLDGFKAINDCYGHRNGDAVLVELARRLRDAAPPGALAARLGGDEFVIVLPSTLTDGEVETAVAELCSSVARPVALDDGTTVTVHATCGRATADATMEPADLLAAADAAMYAAKRVGAAVSAGVLTEAAAAGAVGRPVDVASS